MIRNDQLPLVYIIAANSDGRQWLQNQALLNDVAYIDFSRFQFVTDADAGMLPRYPQNFDDWITDIKTTIAAIEGCG